MAKQMKATDVRLKTVDELKTSLLDLRKAGFARARVDGETVTSAL